MCSYIFVNNLGLLTNKLDPLENDPSKPVTARVIQGWGFFNHFPSRGWKPCQSSPIDSPRVVWFLQSLPLTGMETGISRSQSVTGNA
ncbi:hypothetical protein [Nostoc sp.]|uniref:hypothetical protein n=1 Tax=Nostoc sp. TaxID=1180 RepID=UPI002A5D167B|nr:hypothetical protein [Nostoc sp. S13]